jgi:transcriptional regulator with XRE-family HTH domain
VSRPCAGCGNPLSRYNPENVCRACKASGRSALAAQETGPAGVRAMPDGLTTGKRIQILRERKGLTRPVLAGLVGRSASWLKGIETSRRLPPRLPMLVLLAEVLGAGDIAAILGTDTDLGRPQATADPSFGGKLGELLAERGMSQNEAARRSHYNAGYLSKVINGRKPASAALGRALDEVLSAGGELAALAVPGPPRPGGLYGGALVPGQLTVAEQLEVMSGEIAGLRAEVSALTQAIAFALLAAGEDAGAGSNRS